MSEIYRPSEARDFRSNWLGRLGLIVGGAKVVEIEDDKYSTIIYRVLYMTALDDWKVEFRNPDIFPFKTEEYRLKNGIGLVYLQQKEQDNYVLHKNASGLSSSERLKFYGEAENVVGRLEAILANSRLFLRDGRLQDRAII